MANESIFQEWIECRSTIGRFDGYLFKVRILGLSIFLTGFTVTATLVQKGIELNALMLLGALAVFFFLLVTIYLLDRYYERMLLVAVNRSSGLEAHYLEGFQIGLTTEIEFFKNKSIRASSKVNVMYTIMFLLVIVEYVSVGIHYGLGVWFILPMILIAVVAGGTVYIADSQLSAPYEAIQLRGKIVGSPILASKNEIETIIESLAEDIHKWFIKAPGSELNVITILEGGRRFSEEIISELKSNYDVHINIHNIKIESTTDKNNRSEPKIVWGKISSDLLDGNPTLIIDDLIDSGKTVSYLKKNIGCTNSSEIKVAALLNKFSDNLSLADFVGIDLALERNKENEDKWLFGYGMDISGSYREIDHIGWADK